MSEEEYATLNHKKRLFVDYDDIEKRSNVRRTYYQVQKHGPAVVDQEAEWEKHGGMTASVVYDDEEKVFKMWYMAGFYAEGKEHVQCLALSDDGINWRRPELGLHEACGSRKNNIVIPAEYHDGQDHFESMLIDPIATDPGSRYKAIGWSSYDWDGPLSGIYTAVSADGLNWTPTPEPVFRFHPRPGTDDLGPVGDAQSLMIDTERKRYVAFLRGNHTRLRSASEDFVTWEPPVPFLSILNEEETLYNNTGFNYGAHYLGILTYFDKRPYHQTQVLRLLTSRDGELWMRVPGEPLVPLSGIGEWDRFQIMLTGAPPIPVGDRLYIYYRGTPRRHAKVEREYDPSIAADQDKSTMSIGLGTLRLDGFASMDSSYSGGCVALKPMIFDGNELHINAKCDCGSIEVELLDADDKALPGFTKAECTPIRADGVDLTVRWNDSLSVESLRGKPIRIAFYLTNARLYAYWLESKRV